MATVASLLLGSNTFAAEIELSCVDFEPGYYGPFDYTNPNHVKNDLPVVEAYHFQPVVENLISGQKGRTDPMVDIAYVLRSFPNHHRALYAMLRYELRLESQALAGGRDSADCWFHRALKFKSDDGMVLMIYGIYLHRTGRLDEALERYNLALQYLSNSAELHYNLGLLYLDLSDLESSSKHAAKAYELGYPLPGLRTKLENAQKLLE